MSGEPQLFSELERVFRRPGVLPSKSLHHPARKSYWRRTDDSQRSLVFSGRIESFRGNRSGDWNYNRLLLGPFSTLEFKAEVETRTALSFRTHGFFQR